MQVDEAYATVDTSTFPVLSVRLADRPPSEADIDQMFDALETAVQAVDGRYVTLTLAQSHRIGSDARVRLGQKAAEQFERYRHREIGSVIVTPSWLTKMMLQSIQILFPAHSNHQRVFSTYEKGLVYAQKLAAADREA